MTNNLFVFLNGLKIPKIKKILLYEIKFLVQLLQLPPESLTRGLPPPDPRYLCPLSSTEFVEPPNSPPPKQNSCVRHCYSPDGLYDEVSVDGGRKIEFIVLASAVKVENILQY